MRVMGLDYGSKTVGVAVSDSLLLTAQGVEIVRREKEDKLRQTLARLEEIIKEYEIEKIVLGYPKNMNNTEGIRCEKTKAFAQMLERRTKLPGIRRENRKQYVDNLAAVFILQGYLDSIFHAKE